MTISRRNIADSNGTDPATNKPSEVLAHVDGDDKPDQSSLISELQKERNFLVCKLHVIEIICHAYGATQSPVIQEILRILYEPDKPPPPNATLPENEDH